MTSLSSSGNDLIARVSVAERAAGVAKRQPPRIIELSDAAKALPMHITSIVEPAKLNAQTPFFKCPPWAALPSLACHLHCVRDGARLPSLGLHRFPFYLFGRSDVCDYVLEHPSISNVHAVLVFHGVQQCFVLMDLGSTNGVKLNGSRIEKRKPVPAPVGSRIQFAFSSRVYEVRMGPPLPPKRERDGDIKTENSLITNDKTITSSGMTTVAVADVNHSSAHQEQPKPSSSSLDASASDCAATDTGGKLNATEGEAAPPPSCPARHFYHVLVKHKDVRRPVSLAPRNKGEKITRSRDDAIALSNAILAQHKGNMWSLNEFVDIVRGFSECGSAKKDGDLGMVESGYYEETFDSAAFALECGNVSKPVETTLGVHIIYRSE
ncbi:FHA domain [Trypanosoma vivax]|uniref:Putative peptidyl-prolyl cis-trans isomerase n=1 Tax=Trypanosoma vivax (strain Y486) TaxID=1055687 RepID=G0TY50_TRYVY|nr:putative peptidyl-prolyl cis-trans isomerase [Trypanosoma vivax]KAH8618764.1 FHA domain [Trypanosoma vivax]CCC48895.1 putative peptidyl-prolyl cis-trans isomerase [Trypanosoma vivax Y486]